MAHDTDDVVDIRVDLIAMLNRLNAEIFGTERRAANLEHKSVDLRKHPHQHVGYNRFGLSEEGLALLATIRDQPDDMVARLVFADYLQDNRDDLPWWPHFIRHQVRTGKTWTVSGKNPTFDWRQQGCGHFADINYGFDDGWEPASYVVIRGGMIEQLNCTFREFCNAGDAMIEAWPLREVTIREMVGWQGRGFGIEFGPHDPRELRHRIRLFQLAGSAANPDRVAERWPNVGVFLTEMAVAEIQRARAVREVVFSDAYGQTPLWVAQR